MKTLVKISFIFLLGMFAFEHAKGQVNNLVPNDRSDILQYYKNYEQQGGNRCTGILFDVIKPVGNGFILPGTIGSGEAFFNGDNLEARRIKRVWSFNLLPKVPRGKNIDFVDLIISGNKDKLLVTMIEENGNQINIPILRIHDDGQHHCLIGNYGNDGWQLMVYLHKTFNRNR